MEEVDKMKILVTGANGYLGRGIVKTLLDDGNAVVATDLKLDGVDSRAILKEANLFEITNPYEYFEKPDTVLHLAWRDGFIHNSDAHMADLHNHCEFIRKICESDIQKIAVMGTMHEIGFYEGSIDEHTTCNPMNLYGIAKDALRKITKLYAQQNNIIFQWIRAFYIVGNSEYGNSIFSKIVAAEHAGQSSFPFTTGENQYDFIDYDDFCKLASKIVEQDKINGIINCCSGKPEKLRDRVERFINENGFKIKLEYGAYPSRDYDSIAVWGNMRNFKGE